MCAGEYMWRFSTELWNNSGKEQKAAGFVSELPGEFRIISNSSRGKGGKKSLSWHTLKGEENLPSNLFWGSQLTGSQKLTISPHSETNSCSQPTAPHHSEEPQCALNGSPESRPFVDNVDPWTTRWLAVPNPCGPPTTQQDVGHEIMMVGSMHSVYYSWSYVVVS